MKYNFKFWICFLLMGILLCGCSDLNKEKQENNNTPKDEYVEAKIKGYNSITELENDSDLNVIGKKTGEIDSGVKYNNDGLYELAYTYSSFEINEIINNRIHETEKEIIIFENQAYDEKQNQILHIAGYEKMIEGNTYILYLKATEKNHYVPLSAVIGKIPLNSNEINDGGALYKNGNDNGEGAIEKLHQLIQVKYKDKIQ